MKFSTGYGLDKAAPGHYELAKVIPAPGKPKVDPGQINALLAAAALTPAMDWKQLRTLTREP